MKTSIPDNWPHSNDAIADILKNYKTIAVVGLSSNPRRPSFGVTQYMQSAGYRIIPVNPNETEVLGEKSYRASKTFRNPSTSKLSTSFAAPNTSRPSSTVPSPSAQK